MTSYYPIFLDVTDKKCLVVGGGQVALRKVKALLKHNAQVEVVSPTLCPELSELAKKGTVKAILRDYQSGDLENAFIVVIATSESKINEEVAKEAKERKIPVNVADNPKLSDFIAPSYFQRGDLTIAISTGGKSPALARKIRTELEKLFGDEYASLTLLIEEVRKELKQKGIVAKSDVWQQALNLDLLLELVKSGQKEKAKKFVIKFLEEY